jgi:hypothetical protein
MKRFFLDRLGYAMALNTVVIAMVAMPMLIMSSEIVRALYVNVHIQTAVDAACSAAVQAVDVPHFVATGELVIDSNEASSFAQREFNATVTNSNIQKYSPVLSGVGIVNNTIAQCRASATMIWMLPGVPSLTMNVTSAAEALARR